MSVGRLAKALALSRPAARVGTALVLMAWVLQMGVLVARAYWQERSVALSSDLERYGNAAQWKAVYFKGDKMGFVVTQTVPNAEGFEIQEDGHLSMNLLGTSAGARLRTRAQVDRDFNLRRFRFSLDPGTGPMEVAGSVDGSALSLTLTSAAGTRTETRQLEAPAALSANLSRRLAAGRLTVGTTYDVDVFDPATLRNQKMAIDVEAREVVVVAGRPTPTFRLRNRFAGIESHSWVTELGEVVREESPTGMLVVKVTREKALASAPVGSAHRDLLESAAVIPQPSRRIDDARAIDTLRLRVSGFPLDRVAVGGVGQTIEGNEVVIRKVVDAAGVLRGPVEDESDPASSYLHPEPFIESDAPEIREAAAAAARDAKGSRERAQRLLRFVAGALQKKPTIGIPSALEVLRTRVGDCNEHTALYVALARAAGLPARVAIGVVYVHGAFYYHAWPEVFLGDERPSRWIPVDPTLDQFPADATHLRLARGGLDRQAALLPALGNLRLGILDVTLQPGAQPLLVGRDAPTAPSLIDFPLPRREGGPRACWAPSS